MKHPEGDSKRFSTLHAIGKFVLELMTLDPCETTKNSCMTPADVCSVASCSPVNNSGITQTSIFAVFQGSLTVLKLAHFFINYFLINV
jgi:hypothetical protein